jgi:drug/metabolite transporter (DMT)-like permease
MLAVPPFHSSSREEASVTPDPRRGYAALLAAVFVFGVAPLFVQAVSAPALEISMYSSCLAAVVSFVVAWSSGARLTRTVLSAAVPGGVMFALTQFLAFSAFQETSLANATLITQMTPLIVVVVAVPLFGERMLGSQLAWAALAVVGVVAVILGAKGGGGATVGGDLLAAGSLVSGACALLLMKHRRMAGVGANAYATGVFLVAAMLQIMLWGVTGDGPGGVTGDEWVWVALLAVVSLSMGTGLMAWAQQHVTVGISSVVGLGTTVITAAGAWVIFGQPLNIAQLLGGLAVLVGLGGLVVAQLARPPAL